MLRLPAILSLLGLVMNTSAQYMTFCNPAAGSTVEAGVPFTISLNEHVGLTGWIDEGIELGFRACPSGQCDPASAEYGLGTSLGSPPFKAAYAESGAPSGCRYYGDVTVTIPAGTSGEAQLGVAYSYLLGASEIPETQYLSILLDVVQS